VPLPCGPCLRASALLSGCCGNKRCDVLNGQLGMLVLRGVPSLNIEAAMTTPSQPATLDVEPQYCFGQNHLSWSVSSGPITAYEVQGSASASYTSPIQYYSGTNTTKNIVVSGTTYIRVRACNGLYCSAWRTGDEVATYTSGCL
jgi:hypothetical protein